MVACPHLSATAMEQNELSNCTFHMGRMLLVQGTAVLVRISGSHMDSRRTQNGDTHFTSRDPISESKHKFN